MRGFGNIPGPRAMSGRAGRRVGRTHGRATKYQPIDANQLAHEIAALVIFFICMAIVVAAAIS